MCLFVMDLCIDFSIVDVGDLQRATAVTAQVADHGF